jgi:uncharacterized protein (DUF39 family)
VKLKNLSYALLCNPRNGYQNYNCAVNLSKRTIYTYMGVLKPGGANANYSTSGQLSPLFNDPLYRTLGLGTRIFLGGAQGYITWPGTQHRPQVDRAANDTPLQPAGTLMVIGDLKQMQPRWLLGVSMLGYGCSLAVGLGVPIPILDEEMARYTAVSDEELFAPIVDYSEDYPKGTGKTIGQISYAELHSGSFRFNGREVQTVPLSSLPRAREIAENLKTWIAKGDFLLGEPQHFLPTQ